MSKKSLSAVKAKKILKDGYVKGKPLTAKQKKYFGTIASGATPLKAINGNWLDKFAMGGSLPGASPEEPNKAQDGTVMYGTPEYKKAYEEGTFADIPNQLDEIVIYAGNNYKRQPNYNSLTKAERQLSKMKGPIGRVLRQKARGEKPSELSTEQFVSGLASGLSSVIQAPQSLAIEGIEALRGNEYSFKNALKPIVGAGGKQRMPSETMGFEDKPGWDIGGSLNKMMDVVADPSNLVGLGITKNLTKGAISSIRGNLGKYRLATELTQSPAVAARNRALEWTNTPGFQARYENVMKPSINPKLFKQYKRYNQEILDKGEQTALRLDDLIEAKEMYKRLGKNNVVGNIDDEIQQLTKDLNYYGKLIQSNTNVIAPNVGRSNLKQIQETGKFTEVLRPMGNDIDYYAKNPKTLGFYSGVNNRANLNLDRFENLIPGDAARNFKIYTALGHENRHVITSGNRGLNKETKDQIRQAINSRGSLSKREFDMLPKKEQRKLNYLAKETEVDARIMEIRDNYPEYFKPGTYDVSDNMIDKIIREGRAGNLTVDKKFFNLIKNKEAFKNLFKILPAAAPVGVGLGTATQMKDGGRCWPGYKTVSDKTPFSKGSCQKAQSGGWLNKYQEGGVIEDDRGQWAHPGKVTKINSNNITMKGVNYPVLGISDTGDKKVMQPGKDYKFDGNSVTEYPMTQGKNKIGDDDVIVTTSSIKEVNNNKVKRKSRATFESDNRISKKVTKNDKVRRKSATLQDDGSLVIATNSSSNPDGKIRTIKNKKRAAKKLKNITERFNKQQNKQLQEMKSDIGDTKMMQPGKDYKFKGNSVTEYPIAQKGMNVEGQKQKKWFDSYITSDKYLERLGKEFPDMSADELANERWARLMNMRSTPIGFLPESSEISPEPGSTQGVYNADEYPGNIMLRPEYSEGRQGPWSYNTIPLHEMGHAVDEGGKRIPQTTLDFLMPKLKQNPYDIPKETFYYTKPTEYINRLQPLRYLLQEEGIYDAKKKDFTKEDLQGAKENTRIKYNRHFKDLMENTKSEKDFIEIMNTIAARPQIQQNTILAKNGKSLVDLNQLTNFTNYNTSQPVGWLDKYH